MTAATSFVGRSAEPAALRALLDRHRLVTVTGPGGVGKTRLARQALAARPGDPACWADLGSAGTPERVAQVVTAAARVPVGPGGDALDALTTWLRARRALVCLDTCEHLLDACARLVAALLRTCPEVTVLATSRERLGLPGEQVRPVPPLGPDDAAQLFTERAALVCPDAAGIEPGAVAAICRRLDGIPLAVELAAAWTRVLTPSEIEDRLDDRFELLVDGPRGVHDRHRTLAASIGWSLDLLEPADRRLLRRLSVFDGGFTAEAATAVCGGTLAGIGRLADRSLVLVERRTATRFRLLDSVRAYALREPGEGPAAATALRGRHLDHYVAFAEAAAALRERDRDRWRTVLLAERDNLRAALEWELSRPGPGPSAGHLGGLDVLGDTVADLAWSTGSRGDLATARRMIDPVVAAAGAAAPGSAVLRRFSLVAGTVQRWAGEYREAVRSLGAAAGPAAAQDDDPVVAQALPGLAAALRGLGRDDEARAHAERALRLAAALDLPHVRADALDELAHIARSPAAAGNLHHRALEVRVAAALWTCAVSSYDALARLAAPGAPLRAARVIGACDAARERVDRPRTPAERPGHTALLAGLRAALGPAALATATAEGAALSRDELHAYLNRSRGPRRRPAPGWDGLTRAEREVVALVADGLTNPQIGVRLFMSRSTVKTHLAHVFAKLAVTSRAELAAAAVRRSGSGRVASGG
ncbi:LuxR C-terminal-related transcriptional regulator [Pseudonocardia sp. NPDC046786]|uniref:ATP-binding protein n=1 Tax=Pseudonocardia sp. NPDC046786 TaxID=3155471 RepID=UPI0033E1570F